MSYDLFFAPKDPKIAFEAFSLYFRERENYTLNGTQAWYSNEDTGVYFSFDYLEENESEDDEPYHPFSFNLNFFRPSFFAWEAEPEIRKFVTALDLTVFDPQIEGMGEGEFVSEKFFSGWSLGNNLSYKTFLKEGISGIFSLPEKILKSAWEWNINRKALQSSISKNVFVPKIMFFKYNNRSVTASVWPDAIPSILPPVDVLIINRDNLAPTKLFKKTSDMVIAPWAKFLPSLEKYSKNGNDKVYHLSYQTVPKDLQKLIKSMPSSRTDDLEGLENILERELVEKYSQKAS